MAENDIKYVKFEKVSVRSQGKDETWIEDIISEDPSILGLGDLIKKDRQRRQSSSNGRLDLLLQDDDDTRYEVELQLGAVDPSHIIRAIEYWDIERKIHTRYKHVAVIVAEDITSRFLNVMGLFDGRIPLVAIQMSALKTGSKIGLHFVHVLDQRTLETMEEDAKSVDKEYWQKEYPKTLRMADDIFKIAKQHNPALVSLEMNYTQSYIGPKVGGRGRVFFVVKAKGGEKSIRLDLKIAEQDEISETLGDIGRSWKWRDNYYIVYSLLPDDIKKHREKLGQLIGKAYAQHTGEDA